MKLLPRVCCVFPLLPVGALFLFVVTAPPTVSGLSYVIGALLLVMGGLVSRPGLARRLALAGSLLVVGTAATRVVSASQGVHVGMSAGATSPTSRWVDRLLDEEDLSVNAARALQWTGFVRDPDVPELANAMRAGYSRMRTREGSTPSPVVATYLGLERPGASDTLVIGDTRASAGVLIFLHGFAGSFTLPCWVVAQAAADAGFATVCPSTRWVGDWWTAEGEATLRETLTAVRRDGAKRVVLAGLSNGAIGASLVAPRLRGEVDGLILISGASPDADAPGMPVLVIQGEHDAQIPAYLVHAYAERVAGRYLSLDAGHFALLVREGAASHAISAFLRHGGPRAEAPQASRPAP